jgi:hypothetical protein
MNGKKLKDKVVEMIQESQLKLGFADGSVSVFLPSDSISGDDGSLKSILDEFVSLSEEDLGDVTYYVENGRVAITVPASGSEFVKSMPVNPISRFIIEALGNHATVTELKEGLAKISPSFEWKEVEGDGFRYVLSFPDGTDDRIYCINEEMGHLTYHRFSKEDYPNLPSETNKETEGEYVKMSSIKSNFPNGANGVTE